MLDGGAGILQFRHKGHYSREIFDLAEAVRGRCRDANAMFVVNDRADVAMILQADGLHLGQDDLPPQAARRVYPASSGFIGYSTHNESQFQNLPSADLGYVALGPIFGTSSKANPDPVVGLAELRRLSVRKQHPLVAIGGVTLDLAAAVLSAGADSIAVISALLIDGASATSIRKRTEEWSSTLSVL
jgi:thiamine-phosphate pyrophosphorylase